MIKKVFAFILLLLLCFSLVGCDFLKNDQHTPSDETNYTVLEEQESYKIYRLAASSGYEGTYEEWLRSIKGDKGDAGVGIASITKTDSNGLVDTYTITFTDGTKTTFTITNGAQGEKGDKGDKGDTGEAGAQGEKGDKGDKGDTGETGAQGEKGDKGDTGETGAQGKSAYEIFKDNYPNYQGTEKDWITAVAKGDVCSLFGHNWDEGVITKEAQKGIDGERTYTCAVCGGHKYEVIPMIVQLADLEIFEENGVSYVYFGSYPKNHVNDIAIIEELEKITETNDRGFYEYGGSEYAKITTCASMVGSYIDNFGNQQQYSYSDGSIIVNEKTEYFLVEPIKWRILSNNNDEYLILTEYLLDASFFCETEYDRLIDNQTIHPNNYKYSNIREFINGEFVDMAFTNLQFASIKTVEIDNSAYAGMQDDDKYACANTFDRVFLLSQREANDINYGFNDDNSRCAKVTDFALARGAWMSTDPQYQGNGHWWLRTPLAWTPSNNAHSVREYGTIMNSYEYFDFATKNLIALRVACWVFIGEE